MQMLLNDWNFLICYKNRPFSLRPQNVGLIQHQAFAQLFEMLLFYHLTDWMLYKSPIISIPWETRRRKWLHFSVFGSRQSWVLLSYGYCWNYRFCAVFPAKAGIQYMINMIWHPGCRIKSGMTKTPGPWSYPRTHVYCFNWQAFSG